MTSCPRCSQETELVGFNPNHGGTTIRSCPMHGLVILPNGGEPYLVSEIVYPERVPCEHCGCEMDEGGQCYCCDPLPGGFGRHWAQWRHGALAQFKAAQTDAERLALGLDVLRDAWDEAVPTSGYQVQIGECIRALELSA